MFRQPRDKGEHHFANVALNCLLAMAVHVKVEKTLLLEVLIALLACVNEAGVVVQDSMTHQVLAEVEGTFALGTLKV